MADFQTQVGKTFLYSHTDFSLSHSHTAVIKVKNPHLFLSTHTHSKNMQAAGKMCIQPIDRQGQGKSLEYITHKT